MFAPATQAVLMRRSASACARTCSRAVSTSSIALAVALSPAAAVATPVHAQLPVRLLLDAGKGPDAWSAYTSSATDASSQDALRLLEFVATGSIPFSSARDQRAAIERLFENIKKASVGDRVPAPVVNAILEARVVDADIDGVCTLLLDDINLDEVRDLDIDTVVSLVIYCFARVGDFEFAEKLSHDFVLRHIGLPKPGPAELEARLLAEKAKKEAEHLRRRKLVEDKLIVELSKNSGQTKAAEAEKKMESAKVTPPNEIPASRKANLFKTIRDLCAKKPKWHRYPPLPKDASPSLVKKRSPPELPDPTMLLVRMYHALLFVCTKSKLPESKSAILRILEQMNEFSTYSKVRPNRKSYSIALIPFVRDGDVATVTKLRDDARRAFSHAKTTDASLVLDSQVLFAYATAGTKVNGAERDTVLTAALNEIESLKRFYEKTHAAPSLAILNAMMKVYALGSTDEVKAASWGVVKSFLTGGDESEYSTRTATLLACAADLAKVNGHLEIGKEIAIWDSWFDAVGVIPPRIKYGLGMVGYAQIGDVSVFKAFLSAFDSSVSDPGMREREYKFAIAGLVKSRCIFEAAEFFNHARTSKVKLGRDSYNALIKGLSLSTLEDRELMIMGLVEQMKVQKLANDKSVLGVLKSTGLDENVLKAYSVL
ncbi:hypothetical protein HDU84_007929 [Entophlyctis sp. JEL0112]|nr:hypothetical protein HDU84_007929 [Entophlyctis sp. JEL0112]